MTKQEAEITLKSIEALQLMGSQIGIRLVEVDKLMIAAGELLSAFKSSLEHQLRDIDMEKLGKL